MTEELGRYHDADDHPNYLEQNLRIHDRIWRCCGSAALYDTLSELMAKIRIYHRKTDFVPFSDPPALEKSFGDHLEILRLIEARDIDAAREADRSPLGRGVHRRQRRAEPEEMKAGEEVRITLCSAASNVQQRSPDSRISRR